MRFNLRKALAGAAVFAALATVGPFIGGITPALAATNNGVATINPTSGTSATSFTLGLGANPVCPGDSASGGYRVQSFMIPASADIDATLTFGANGPTAVSGQFRQPLFDFNSSPYVNKLTNLAVPPAVTGGISGLPQFNWGSVFAPGDVPAGQYKIGIACTLGAAGPTQLKSYWSRSVTVTATGVGTGGPSQFNWVQGAVAQAPVLGSPLGVGNASLTATFTQPGTPDPVVTGYTATATPTGGGAAVTATGASSPITIAGLANGTSYNVTVRATNTAGNSAESNIVAGTPAGPTGVSGTVTDAGSGAPVPGAWVAVLRTSDYSVAGGAAANASGDYSAAVPAGSYYLYQIDPAGAHTAGFFGPPTAVTVTAGSMVDRDPTMVSSKGTIAGAVTDSGSAAPIPGAWVIGINAATGATARGAVANGSGAYSIGGLAPGPYRPVYLDPTGGHASRYSPNSVDFLGATSLAVTANTTTTANVGLPAQSTTPGPATLSGTIRETGSNTPLGGVFVVALRASDFRNAGGAVTNVSGQYSLNVAAGDYKLAFIDSEGRHLMEWHNNQPASGLATATSVTAPAVTDAALDATTGTLAGTVTDDPAATPVAGAWVIAINASGAIAAGGVTAANGTFTIAGLPAGVYRATIVDPNGGRVQEYWQNSTNYAGSTPITITGGATATINPAIGH